MHALSVIREGSAGLYEGVFASVFYASVAVFADAVKDGAASFAAMRNKRNRAVGTQTVPTALFEFIVADSACKTLGIQDPAYGVFYEGQRFHRYFANLSVSRAITSSSLVGITYTSTFESSVESFTASPLGHA